MHPHIFPLYMLSTIHLTTATRHPELNKLVFLKFILRALNSTSTSKIF